MLSRAMLACNIRQTAESIGENRNEDLSSEPVRMERGENGDDGAARGVRTQRQPADNSAGSVGVVSRVTARPGVSRHIKPSNTDAGTNSVGASRYRPTARSWQSALENVAFCSNGQMTFL